MQKWPLFAELGKVQVSWGADLVGRELSSHAAPDYSDDPPPTLPTANVETNAALDVDSFYSGAAAGGGNALFTTENGATFPLSADVQRSVSFYALDLQHI